MGVVGLRGLYNRSNTWTRRMDLFGCEGPKPPKSTIIRQTKPKKFQFMNFSRGQTGTKVRCESRLLSQGKTPEVRKMGEIHELFVLALSLVWFAGATHDIGAKIITLHNFIVSNEFHRLCNIIIFYIAA